MSPRTGAGLISAARVALGLAVLAAPARVTEPWLGRHASHPTVRYLALSLGTRDLALGVIGLATLEDPVLGPRAQAAAAAVDALDALATFSARSDLRRLGALGMTAAAGATAAAGFYFAHRLANA